MLLRLFLADGLFHKRCVDQTTILFCLEIGALVGEGKTGGRTAHARLSETQRRTLSDDNNASRSKMMTSFLSLDQVILVAAWVDD
jgi:hypothetical protein